jgi:hypothetical protein
MNDLPENAKKFFNDRFEIGIDPEDMVFVDRLEKDLQLRNFVYQDIDGFLPDWRSWVEFLRLAVGCAGLMQPEKTKEARVLKKQAEALQRDIALCCEKLANSIDALDNIGEQGCIDTPYIGNPIDVVIEAGENNILFEWHIKENLQKANLSFDSKYGGGFN